MQRTSLRDTHSHRASSIMLRTMDSGLPRLPSQGSWLMPDHQAHVFVWGLGAGIRNPSQTWELSRSPLVAADVVSHDLSQNGICVTSWRAHSSAEGSSGARGTRSSPCPSPSASSGTVCKPCLITFLELSSCLCMKESRPHLSLCAPHRCAKRPQPVSNVFNVAATRESSLAKWLSQLSRSLPVCCKVTGFSLEPHALSLFRPWCRCSFRCCRSRDGLFCSADLFIDRRLPLHVGLGHCSRA